VMLFQARKATLFDFLYTIFEFFVFLKSYQQINPNILVEISSRTVFGFFGRKQTEKSFHNLMCFKSKQSTRIDKRRV